MRLIGSEGAGALLTPLIELFNYNLLGVYSTSSLITLSWSFTGLFLLILRTRIKQISSSNLGEDSNRGFSYIIGSWLIEEGQKSIVITLYITNFLSNFLKKYIYVFLVVAFYSILSASQY